MKKSGYFIFSLFTVWTMVQPAEAGRLKDFIFFWREPEPYEQYEPRGYERGYERGYYEEERVYTPPPRKLRNPRTEEMTYYEPVYQGQEIDGQRIDGQESGRPARKPVRPAQNGKKPQLVPKKPATKPTTKPTAVAKTAMSCEKAGEIVTGYGFNGVAPASCAGNVYAFNATRGGKPFSVKVNAATGELTEVKKQ